MKKQLLFLSIFFSFFIKTEAQTGCPGCQIKLDTSLAVDTAYLSAADAGFVNLAYDFDLSFRLPLTTTPVYAIDSMTPPGLPIDDYEITDLSNLPPGLSWEADTTKFSTDVNTDGCAKICGIPTETGQFFVGVELEVTVLGFKQSTSFDFPITIYPEPNDTVPVELFGNYGCGATTINFFNNIQSNGNPGFEYLWDFGNLTISQEEFPDPVTYDSAGIYPIFYRAKIDTAGFNLSQVTVVAAECDDFAVPPLISGNPDLYLQIENTAGDILLTTPVKDDANFPADFNLNLPLSDEDFLLKVFDQDGLLAGADDLCGQVIINQNSSGNLKDSTILEVGVSVFHPVQIIDFIDTVVIYEAAPVPVVSPENITVDCRDTLELSSSLSQNIEWFYEGNSYSNETKIQPDEPGRYWVTFTDPGSGCTATSDTASVPELIRPPVPAFENEQNWLTISDSIALPANYTIQWFLEGDSLVGEIGMRHCAKANGNYSVILTDVSTGCVGEFEADIIVDPNGVDCFSGTKETLNIQEVANVFPNPTNGFFNIELKEVPSQNWQIRLFTSDGKKVIEKTSLAQNESIDLMGYSSGIYLLQIVTRDNVFASKILKR